MESVMFHLRAAAPPLSLSLSLHQKPPMFYSGPGLGEGSGWVCWPAVLVGTKVSEKTLLGLPMIGSDNQIMKQAWIDRDWCSSR